MTLLRRFGRMSRSTFNLQGSGRNGFKQKEFFKQFIAVLFLTITIVVILEVFFMESSLKSSYPALPQYGKPTYFYTVNDIGSKRLGNSMFLVASLIGISNTNNATPILTIDNQLLQIFDLKIPLTSNLDNTFKSMYGRVSYHEEFGRRGGAYDRATRRLYKLNSHITLGIYLQSFKYFIDSEAEVRSKFRFKRDIDEEARLFHESHLRSALSLEDVKDYVKVGVHIRRGDMAEPYYVNFGYITAPVDYYPKAMKHFTERYHQIIFIVCTDDIVWAKENIKSPVSGSHVVFSEGHSAAVDMAILTRCNHTIMSVGSFGWWAAWLTNGTTIYYSKWPRPSTQLEYHVQKQDYFPPDWIGLS